MKKFLKMAMSSIVVLLLLVSTVNSAEVISEEQFREQHRNQIIKFCEYGYLNKDKSELYYCILAEFYALEKVIDHVQEISRESEDWNAFVEILEANYYMQFQTYDFMAVDLDFEEYLQEKENNNEGNNLPDRSDLGR